MFLDENITEENCASAPIPPKVQTIKGTTSTPNIQMILKIGQLVSLVDDFMFFAYHDAKYGKELSKFLFFMWNVSVTRWIPS
jgi:hypothetical protein